MKKDRSQIEKKNKLESVAETRTLPKNASDEIQQMLKTGKSSSLFRKIVFFFTAVAVIGSVAFGVLRWRSETNDAKRPQYVTDKITQGDLVATISATGTVEALNTVEVGAEISGRILSLSSDFNDSVTQGQVLAVIDPEQHRAAVAQAKAQMLSAEAQVAEAEATLVETKQDAARAKELAAKGLYSAKERENAETKAIRAEASVKSAKASLALSRASYDAAKSRLGKTEVISPISGTVLSRKVEVGQTVNAGMQTPVLYIIAEDLSRMRLLSLVDEADIGKVANGQNASFSVDAFPGRKFVSSVLSVRNIPQTTQNVVSYEVLLSVDNKDNLLKPGMTASVEIIIEKHENVLLIPNKAFRFSPSRESTGMRRPPGGGIPLLRNANEQKEKKASKKSNPLRELGKISGNEAVLWIPVKDTPDDMLPVKVERIASDGQMTAISSDRLKIGDDVIIEQTDSEQKAK